MCTHHPKSHLLPSHWCSKRKSISSPGFNPGSNIVYSCHVSFVSFNINFCFVFHELDTLKHKEQLLHSKFITLFHCLIFPHEKNPGYTFLLGISEWCCVLLSASYQEELLVMIALNILLMWCLQVVSMVNLCFSLCNQ